MIGASVTTGNEKRDAPALADVLMQFFPVVMRFGGLAAALYMIVTRQLEEQWIVGLLGLMMGFGQLLEKFKNGNGKNGGDGQ